MKKLFATLIAFTMCFMLASCSSDNQGGSGDTKSVDEQISIVGQVASTVRDDDSTLSVQVQNEDGRWVIYHCEMTDEFLDEAKEFKLADIAKIKGYLLNETNLGQENTAIIVNLYDCEIVE